MEVVKIPFDRYSHNTSIVEAGSVAEAIAPNTAPDAIEIMRLPVIKYITAVDNVPTRRKAPMPSHNRIEVNWRAYFRNVFVFRV